MKLIIQFKPESDILRVVDYLSHLPPAKDYTDILDKIELPEPEL